MAYLLESLGRGLLGSLSSAFEAQLADTCDLPTVALVETARERPNDAAAQVRLGRRYLKEARFSPAKDAFSRALRLERHNLAARLGLLCALDELGRPDEVLKHLRTAQRLLPTDPSILFALGLIQERRGDLRQASRYYHDALTYCPQLRNAHERLAAMAMHADRIGEAVKHYDLLCEWDPGDVETRLTLANLLLVHGLPDEAIAHYEHALTIEPENWVAHNDLASAYEQAGLIDEAIEQLHVTLEEQPGYPDNHLRLGDLYAKLGNDGEALHQYNLALEIQPDHLEAVVKMGTQHLRSGRYIEAARWFNRAVEVNDRLLLAYVGLGLAQRESGRTEDALASFEMAASIEPNSTLLFSEMARLQLKAAMCNGSRKCAPFLPDDAEPSDDAEDTIAHLIDRQIERHCEALRRRPNHADMHYRLGVLLRNRGRTDEAIEAYGHAVEINPVYVKALIKLGLALKESDRVDEAVEVLSRVAELQPDAVDLHYHLGLLFIERNRFELAVEHFEQSGKTKVNDVDFHANLALALQNMGLLDRASATWQAISELISAPGSGPEARRSPAEE